MRIIRTFLGHTLPGLRLAAMILAMNCAASAQWVSLKLPNTPRTPDGSRRTRSGGRPPDGNPAWTGRA